MEQIANVREIDFVDGLNETIYSTLECRNDVMKNATLSHLSVNLCNDGREIGWYFK